RLHRPGARRDHAQAHARVPRARAVRALPDLRRPRRSEDRAHGVLRDPAGDPARVARLPRARVPRARLPAGDRPLPGGRVGLPRHALRLHRQAGVGPGRIQLHAGTIRYRPDVMDLCFTPARRLAQLLRSRKLSATEVVRAFIAQIERVNPKVNAIVTFLPEEALKAAKAADRRKPVAPLAGLPIAFKDMLPTKGIRTTFGSPIFAHNVPEADALIVERLRAAGAIPLG